MDEAQRLARQFAATLEHLRLTWGVQYVPLGQTPGASPDVVSAPARELEDNRARKATTHDRSDSSARSQSDNDPRQWSADKKLAYLRDKNIGDCQRCALCKTRTNIVFGVGDPQATIMFVGEAPGADEDRKGEPFVGRAGQRLDVWIEALGLSRSQVYIANVLKCRPPNNRDPKPEEVQRCSPFLKAQIRAIEPKVLIALGRHAGMLLCKRGDLSLRAMRSDPNLTYDAAGPKDVPGTRNIPLVVTYHPAYVLRQERNVRPEGRASAEDLVMQDLHRAIDIAARPTA